MNLKKETQFLNQVQVLSENEAMKYHKKLLKIGRIFSEQYICVFQLPGELGSADIMYFTEHKNMHKQVKKRFREEFQKSKLIEIMYC